MQAPRAHGEGGDQAGDPLAVKGQGEIPGALVPSLGAIPAGMRKEVPSRGAPTYKKALVQRYRRVTTDMQSHTHFSVNVKGTAGMSGRGKGAAPGVTLRAESVASVKAAIDELLQQYNLHNLQQTILDLTAKVDATTGTINALRGEVAELKQKVENLSGNRVARKEDTATLRREFDSSDFKLKMPLTCSALRVVKVGSLTRYLLPYAKKKTIAQLNSGSMLDMVGVCMLMYVFCASVQPPAGPKGRSQETRSL
jgi:FtsZ-binding cell division protein ZapB